MIYLGDFEYTVDVQGRITLPGEWRSEEESSWVLLPEGKTALILTTEEALGAFFAELQKLSLADPALRLASARLGSLARSCRCDRQGRLALPKTQLEAVGISKTVKLLGAVTHIRLCAPENWKPGEVDTAVAGALNTVKKLGNDRGALASLIEGLIDHE
ncbi:MAG: hypothetical protein IJT50_03790 [Lentisphaeria bacterium]|nr:hypothetical protein [Lentisphaeria bacterium]